MKMRGIAGYSSGPSSSLPVSLTTCSRLVEPGVPKGTPANVIRREPALPNWWRSAMRLHLAIISSKLDTRNNRDFGDAMIQFVGAE